jgi:hypothetical protein
MESDFPVFGSDYDYAVSLLRQTEGTNIQDSP